MSTKTNNIGNTAYTAVATVITNDRVKKCVRIIAFTVGLKFFYALAEWFGKKAYTLTEGRISEYEIPETLSYLLECYAKYTGKKVVQLIGDNEHAACKKLHAESYKAHPSALKTRLLRQSVSTPFFTFNIASPIAEEVTYRLPITYMKPGKLKTIAMLISSLAFASAHQALQPGRNAALVATGLFLSWIADNFGLTTAILSHAGYNLYNWAEEASHRL